MPNLRRIALAFLALLVAAPAAQRGEAAIPGGTHIVNVADATYNDASGKSFATISNTSTSTVAAVGALVVGPNDPVCHTATDGFPSGNPVVETFTVTNSSNVSDSYTIVAASTSAGTITSIAFVTAAGSTPVTPGTTVSPVVPATKSLQLVVSLGTVGLRVGTDAIVRLTVRTTSHATNNGLQSAPGSVCAIAQLGATFSGTHGIGSAIVKAVDSLSAYQSGPGSVITYQIPFSNSGGAPTTNAVFTDNVPLGALPDASTVEIDGVPAAGAATLSGQQLRVALGTINAGTTETISFNATLARGLALGTSLVNVGTLAADNAVMDRTNPASVLAGIANVVYDGYTGASEPVAGAVVTLVADTPGGTTGAASSRRANAAAAAGAPIQPAAPTGSGPNTKNTDPYTTGSTGTYGFGLSAAQFTSTDYDLVINAAGYLLRRIHLSLVADPTKTFYTVQTTALDGQPLALAGSFTLTATGVTLSNVYGLFGNIPLFRPHAIALTKEVDRSAAATGDRLVYTIAASSAAQQLGATAVVDTLPPGVAYAPGTGRVNGASVEPVISGRTLTWQFAHFDAEQTIVFAAVVVPGVSDGTVLTNNATVSAHLPNSQNITIGTSATATTEVIPGVFSNRTVITGRVFADVMETGRFARGDRGLGRVRLYLEDGESVLTDPLGRFSFPGVRPGMHTLRIDTTTLPPHTQAYDDFRIDSERSPRRLIHGIFDGGVMQDINFAIEVVQ